MKIELVIQDTVFGGKESYLALIIIFKSKTFELNEEIMD